MAKLNLVSKLGGIILTAAMLNNCKLEPKVGYDARCTQYVQKEKNGYRYVCESFTKNHGDFIMFKMIEQSRDEKLTAYGCNPKCEEWECYKTKEGKYSMYVTAKCSKDEQEINLDEEKLKLFRLKNERRK